MARDGYRCVYCGVAASDMTLSLDHLMPRSRGGDNTDANLVTACFPCNGEKRDRTIAEWSASDDYKSGWPLCGGITYLRDFSRFSSEQRGEK